MIQHQESSSSFWKGYTGPNLGYMVEQYEHYLANPESVDPEYQQLFAKYGAPSTEAEQSAVFSGNDSKPQAAVSGAAIAHAVAATRLIWNIRTYGHLDANIDPLQLRKKTNTDLLKPETYGLRTEDLQAIPASFVLEYGDKSGGSAHEAVNKLLNAYTGTIAFEFNHVHEEEERNWLNSMVESGVWPSPLGASEKMSLLDRLFQVEEFEAFLQRTFVGQKRFSIEGLDVLVPMLDEIVRECSHDGANQILIGMAHRGRLNVLAHVLGKPYKAIFADFHHAADKDMLPSEGSLGINSGWTGDVKYHLGARYAVRAGETTQTRITLANNPSHLEFVGPVIEGFTRAAQEERGKPGYPTQHEGRAAAIIIHGDAAFPGEGVVAETLNFNQLTGYQTGGSIHIIANNQIGFTTKTTDSRSTHYASDLAKGFEIPIVHVNADDPEACIASVRMACEYRNKFHKDFLIDLVGYRKYGHNETDDPSATQPIMYEKITKHPTVSAIYAEKIRSSKVATDQQLNRIKQEAQLRLREAYDELKDSTDEKPTPPNNDMLTDDHKLTGSTAVELEQLQAINKNLLTWPGNFKVYPKLRRILERRSDSLNEGGSVDWALAETLAFATILADGRPIRLTGQDTQRGTFAHRHLVLHDAENGTTMCPLHELPQAKASFAIHNSPLSEASVIGFEYGYNVYAPETLVIWEAQFGDFANAGQVMIDQFVAAGQAKWSERSGLVMLLPHGYEGQGPEHSSARLERYLQSAAENNWMIVNLTSAAQYFHLLRRQAALIGTGQVCPLIVMAPKSLLRNPHVASPVVSFTDSTFQTVLEKSGPHPQPELVERLILCSGKIAVDLEEKIENSPSVDFTALHVARVERLYPFPYERLAILIDQFKNLKEIVWVQEEPHNMGAWRYIEPHIRQVMNEQIPLRYIGRPERASTASGYQHIHILEQRWIVSHALNMQMELQEEENR